MKVHSVWAVRTSHPNEPELVTAWDEFSVDGNPEGFEQDWKSALESWGSDLLAFRHIDLEVYYPAILMAFEAPKLQATVTDIE